MPEEIKLRIDDTDDWDGGVAVMFTTAGILEFWDGENVVRMTKKEALNNLPQVLKMLLEDKAPILKHQVGDVFQINEKHGRQGWIGAFVLATEIKDWGIQGFVSHIETHEEQNRAYIRLKWEEIDFVGHAPLIPSDYVDYESMDPKS